MICHYATTDHGIQRSDLNVCVRVQCYPSFNRFKVLFNISRPDHVHVYDHICENLSLVMKVASSDLIYIAWLCSLLYNTAICCGDMCYLFPRFCLKN